MVVDYQRAFIVAQSLQFVDGYALPGLGLSVAEPVRFEPVVGVQEYEVAPLSASFIRANQAVRLSRRAAAGAAIGISSLK